jgi:putative ABC transport system permease protein
MIRGILQDVRHGARMLVKNPGFAFVAIVSIAIGVGANAAMFSFADAIVLRPLTVPRADEVITVTTVAPASGFAPPTSAALSYPDYVDVRDQARSFASLVAYQLVVASVATRPNEPAQRKFGLAVSGNFFDALQVQPILGRAFGSDADRVGSPNPVVVLDNDTWREEFASDAGILGRSIRIGGIELTVVGVMPRGFTGPDQWVLPGYYIPNAMLPRLRGMPADALTARGLRNFAVKGRLLPGVPVSQASEEVEIIGANLRRDFPDTNRNLGLAAKTEFRARVDARPQLAVGATMLITLAVVVLCVACANVAGLLSSRAPVRAREMALRLSIGAGRTRLVRQLLLESLVLAAGGGAAGLLVGYGVIAVLGQLDLPTDVPLKLTFAPDERVVFVGIVAATLSALAASLAPAWQSTRVDLVSSLKSHAAADPRRSRLWGRNLLVGAQVALSLFLLTVAVFMYRGFQAELAGGPGFRTDRILTMAFQPDLAGYDVARAERFYRLLKEATATLPGVESATLTTSVPMDAISIENTTIAPEGFQFPAGTDNVRVRSARIDEDYFDTLGISVIAGRAFGFTDTPEAPRVAVVNDTFAARYWPGQSVLGKRFRRTDGDRPWIGIVGVVPTHKYRAVSEAPTPFIYYPLAQNPTTMSTILVAANTDAAALAAPLRQAVRNIDPNMPIFDVRTMEDLYSGNAVGLFTLLVQLIGGMGSMGLAMSVIGLYGLMAYSVSQRTREIGIRMAVGAHPSTVLRMVLRHGLLLAVSGIVVGSIGSVATRGLLRAVFPFPHANNLGVTVYLIVVPALLAITLTAAYIPARRASRIDPLMALRQE